MTRKHVRWCRESVEAEARKYSKVTDFKYGGRGAYKWAERHGVLKEVTAHIPPIRDRAENTRGSTLQS